MEKKQSRGRKPKGYYDLPENAEQKKKKEEKLLREKNKKDTLLPKKSIFCTKRKEELTEIQDFGFPDNFLKEKDETNLQNDEKLLAVQNLHCQIDKINTNSIIKLHIPEETIDEIEMNKDIYCIDEDNVNSHYLLLSPKKNPERDFIGNERLLENYNEINYTSFISENKEKLILNTFDPIIQPNERKQTQKSEIVCYNDHYPILNRIYGMPILKTESEYKISRCFCSTECMVSYLFRTTNYSFHLRDRIYTWINELYPKEDQHGNLIPIQEALNLDLLDIFGGPYNIEQYRTLSSDYSKEITMNYLPITPHIGYISEMCIEYKKVSSRNANEISENNNLRLKRHKPKIRNSSIEKTLNFY